MKIILRTKHPHLEANNVTTATSKEFADLLRELKDKDDSEKVEGRFTIYRENKGPVIIDLVFDKEEG